MKLELYEDCGGTVLALNWLGGLPERVRGKFTVRLERFVRSDRLPDEAGIEAGPDELFSLGVRDRGLSHRLFFFLHGRRVILSHGCIEERDQRDDEWHWLELRRADYRRSPHDRAFVLREASSVGPAAAPSTETHDALAILDSLHPRLTPAQTHALVDAREEARLARSFARSRKRAGLSRSELAGRLGVCVSTIRGLEEGDSEGYSLSFLRRAALMLDVRLQTRLDPTPRLVTHAS